MMQCSALFPTVCDLNLTAHFSFRIYSIVECCVYFKPQSVARYSVYDQKLVHKRRHRSLL